VKSLYLVGTQRDVGKTTLAIGLLHALRQRGLKVAYMKPLGQRVTSIHGRALHDDARLVDSFLGIDNSRQVEMAVPLPSGRVEKEVHDLHTDELIEKVVDAHSALARDHDAVIVESMGHVAMGSCLGLSSAQVAKSLGARALLVSGGGIGRAIDDIDLCATFLTACGADLIGVVINKVWPEKYDRVKEATPLGLKNLGISCYGVVPYEQQLASPTMQQVYDHLNGELITGEGNLDMRVMNTIVAAMEARHMVRYITEATLVITPGDRTDNILASLSTHLLGEEHTQALAGLILTGGFQPEEVVMRLITDAQVPVITVAEDTYTTASKLRQTVFKITPDDHERIERAIRLVAEFVDIDRIVKALGG